MGTAVPVEPLEGKKYKTIFSTMKAFVAVAMAAAAQAAPEADPQLLLANPVVYGTAHTQTMGMVHHANGAVVPDDTLSVKAAKVDHLNAKATAYLNKPIVPVVQTVAAKPVVQTIASPVVSYSGLYNPYGLLNTHLFKREAEAEADPLSVYHGIQAPLTYTGMYNYQLPVVAKSVYSGLNAEADAYWTPAVYTASGLIKREAEAEADPAVFYNNLYNAPAYTAGVYNGYTTGLNYAYNPVYGYNNYGYNYLY